MAVHIQGMTVQAPAVPAVLRPPAVAGEGAEPSAVSLTAQPVNSLLILRGGLRTLSGSDDYNIEIEEYFSPRKMAVNYDGFAFLPFVRRVLFAERRQVRYSVEGHQP
jgi:predicted amino acid dehydrogenase